MWIIIVYSNCINLFVIIIIIYDDVLENNKKFCSFVVINLYGVKVMLRFCRLNFDEFVIFCRYKEFFVCIILNSFNGIFIYLLK